MPPSGGIWNWLKPRRHRERAAVPTHTPHPPFVIIAAISHDSTATQPFPKHPTTIPQPRHNHPSCRIQERFRHNHTTSVILQLQPQNSAADSPRIKVLYTRSAVECAGDCGGRGRTRPRDSRPRRGRRAGQRLMRRAFAKAGRCGTFAVHRPRRCRVAASRSLPCPRRPDPYPRRKDRDSSYVIPIAADLPRCHSPYLENKCSSLSMPSAADLPRLFQHPPGNSRVAWPLPDSEVILVVDIAGIPVKRAFRGVCHHPDSLHVK